jgi:hypothetical protein
MFKIFSTTRRRQAPRNSVHRDRRTAAPIRRRPEPMPRMRWY